VDLVDNHQKYKALRHRRLKGGAGKAGPQNGSEGGGFAAGQRAGQAQLRRAWGVRLLLVCERSEPPKTSDRTRRLGGGGRIFIRPYIG